MDPNAGSFEPGQGRIPSEEGRENSLLGRLQHLDLGGETGTEQGGLVLQWGQSLQGAQLQQTYRNGHPNQYQTFLDTGSTGAHHLQSSSDVGVQRSLPAPGSLQSLGALHINQGQQQFLNSSQPLSSSSAQATFQGNYNQSQTSYNWAQPAQSLGYLPSSAILARNFNGLPLTVGSPIVGESREPVEGIENEILELERQVEQEYKDFCYHRSIRQNREVSFDNLKAYVAVLEQTLLNTFQRSQQLQIKLLFGADIGNQFENLVATLLTHLFPQVEEKFLKRNWEKIRRGKRPLPRFPPGGPVYLNRTPKLFKIQIKLVIKAYAILESNLCVCKIKEQEYDDSIDVEAVHELQEYQFEEACTEVEYPADTFPIPNSFLPTTSEGGKIPVQSFARVIERISYFFCFDPPLSPDAVPLENLVAKDKDLVHIWAGSGSASGKETVRRRERTPIKTGTILRKRKSSARIGFGMDGSGSSEDIGQSSPGPSPRRDSGVDSVMASEADSDDSIITVINIPTYDVEEDMVKPLNVGSLDGEGNLITIGKMESGLKMLREDKMSKNLHDELEYSSTPSKVKGKSIASMDMDDSKGEGADDFSSSLRGLSRILASNHRMFLASREEEDRIKDSDNNVFAKNKSLSTKHSTPTGLPLPSDILDTPAEDTQAVWHEYAFPGSKNESDSHTTSVSSCDNINSSESENELERLFKVDSVHTSEPEIRDGYLSYEISTPINIKDFDFDSENENKSTCYSNVECVQDSETERKDKDPDIKFTHEIDIDLNLEEEEKEPEKIVKSQHELLWDEISKSVDKALDASQENRRKESIRGFSLKVPHLVYEAKQGLYRSPSPTRSSKSNEIVGEVSSLKEIEFCASGLKDCGMEEGNLVASVEELGKDCSAQMQRKDDRTIASREGVSSNFGSPISLSVMGSGGRDYPESGLTEDEGDLGVSIGVDDENCKSSDSPCRQVKIRISGDEVDGHSSDHKGIREDSVERENERNIANSERFSPVHQRVIQLMTPKHGRYRTVREKVGKTPASYRMSDAQVNKKNASHGLGSVAMERKASRYPAKERAFSQPCWSNKMNWVHHFSPGSFRADESKDSDGNGSEEWLLGKEGCSEIEEEMEKFWKRNSEGPMAQFRKAMENMNTETDTKREERKKLPVMDRKMKRKMADLGSWESTTDENERVAIGPMIIRRSMPQLDGPSSPPLLVAESPAGSTRSPSPRKRLQKVNRSKSPTLMKSSSSSLGKIFQNSRVEGMEGEVRDLKREVEELKNMIGRLEREFEVAVSSRGEGVGVGVNRIEGRFMDKMNDVWSVVYGKDWEEEDTGEEGRGWIYLEEIEWMREVRDVGLLKIVGRMKKEKDMEEIMRAVDGFLKEKQNKSFEKDLMVPSSINTELENEDVSAPKISMEKRGSRGSAIGGRLRIDQSCTVIPQREIGELSEDEVGLEGEIAGSKGERWDLKGEKSEGCDIGMLGDVRAGDWIISRDSEVKDCGLVSAVPLCVDQTGVQSESRTPRPLNIQKLSDLPRLESSEEIERERMRKAEESRKSEMVCGRVTRNEKCEKRGGDNESELEQLDEGFNKEYKRNRKVEMRYVDSEGNFMDQRDAFKHLSSQFKGLKGGKRREKGKGKEVERMTGIVGEGEGVGVMKCEHGCKIIGGRRLNDMEMEGLLDAEILGGKGTEMEKSDFDVSVKGNGKGAEVERGVEEAEKKVEDLVKDLLKKQEGERMKREEWWEREREGDKKEIQRLGGVVEELRELILSGIEKGKEKEKGGVCNSERRMLEEDGHEDKDKDEMHDCDKPGCWCQPSGSGSGMKGGRKHECGASNVANMRARDVYGDGDKDEDGEWDSEERGVRSGNGKGFWDWVGGGILWRQD
ncbi:uncharacterized protein EAE97_011789 [Botrytis byssoidea]|uniref:Uncharacterized protein n=1 Tax=Botrytis byssoidea TaxID=139641 RepID=A0A9P5HSD8_9HELO|nr:uncharacterized protein EAE97_011789 [Botrytis byssoidea]KAF7918694.1 hypothetical protein EAE97_011789 [Botrytis byssoidea]